MSAFDPAAGSVHGYVIAICTSANPNYFTGAGYSVHIDDAKVFRTIRGAKVAAWHWQHADYNPSPLPPGWFASRKALPVILVRVSPML